MADKTSDSPNEAENNFISKAESYVFVPIWFKRDENDSLPEDVETLIKQNYDKGKDKSKNESAKEKGDDCGKYLLKYVIAHNRADTNESGQFTKIGIHADELFEWKGDSAEKSNEIELKVKDCKLNLLDISVYVFSTGIGIISYHFSYENISIKSLTNASFKIKLASWSNNLSLCNQNVLVRFKTKENSLVQFNIEDISLAVCDNLQPPLEYDLFFYCQDTAKQCNVLTMYSENNQSKVSDNLRYLASGFNPVFQRNVGDIFQVAKNQVCYATSEGAVCAVLPSKEKDEEKQFNNFRDHTLMIFVLALHQKYELYHFLMVISENLYGRSVDSEKPGQRKKEIENLKNYRQKLSLFEKDYSFNVITEIPLYQMIYEELCKAFRIQKMYHDVHEPLTELNILYNEKHDRRINKILTVITFITLISVALDLTDLVKELFYGDKEMSAVIVSTSPSEIKNLIIAALLILLLVVLLIIRSLRRDE